MCISTVPGDDEADLFAGMDVPARLDAARDLGDHLHDLAPGNRRRLVLDLRALSFPASASPGCVSVRGVEDMVGPPIEQVDVASIAGPTGVASVKSLHHPFRPRRRRVAMNSAARIESDSGSERRCRSERCPSESHLVASTTIRSRVCRRCRLT